MAGCCSSPPSASPAWVFSSTSARSTSAGLACGRFRHATMRPPQEGKRKGLSLVGLLRPLPMPIRAIVIKDWITLPRDIRQLSGLVFPILMAFVYIYMTASGDTAKQIPGAASWMALAIVPLLPYFLTLYYTVGTIGIEGKNFALLRVAPLSGSRLLWGKFWASLGPTLLIGEIAALVVAILVKATPLQIVLAALAMVLVQHRIRRCGHGHSVAKPQLSGHQYTPERRHGHHLCNAFDQRGFLAG